MTSGSFRPMTRAQILRQRHREEDGKYSRVNACYVCGRSSGEDYYSHRDTDVCIGDALLQICGECAASTRDLRGPDALLWARSRRAMADLPADSFILLDCTIKIIVTAV